MCDKDSLTPSNIKGKPFSTVENDVRDNCSATFQAGWWFAKNCKAANLNGPLDKCGICVKAWAYKEQFGAHYNTFWIGNVSLHQITKQGVYRLDVGVAKHGESPCQNGGEYLDAEDRCRCVESYAGLTCQRIMRGVLREKPMHLTDYLVLDCSGDQTNCSEGHIDRIRVTQEFYIQPKDSPHPFRVKCNNHATGGMTHLTFRSYWANPKPSFVETWQAYKEGFGNRYKDFWIGNEYIHQITRQGEYEVEVGVALYGESFKFVYYDSIYVGNETERYAIHLGPYRPGTMDGDSLTPSIDPRRNINGKPFSTYDNDVSNDCTTTFQAGWWFAEDCTAANLNGPLLKTNVPRLNYLYNYGSQPLQGGYMQIRVKKYYSEMP
ncbi:fibrinogen-like protein 1 [Liolophura sinensis]|uniref:fibrinogen-like protein 1 n=1 Tax=Liolophura sinensis TaxID=3198878 RepID=UPI003158F9C8